MQLLGTRVDTLDILILYQWVRIEKANLRNITPIHGVSPPKANHGRAKHLPRACFFADNFISLCQSPRARRKCRVCLACTFISVWVSSEGVIPSRPDAAGWVRLALADAFRNGCSLAARRRWKYRPRGFAKQIHYFVMSPICAQLYVCRVSLLSVNDQFHGTLWAILSKTVIIKKLRLEDTRMFF